MTKSLKNLKPVEFFDFEILFWMIKKIKFYFDKNNRKATREMSWARREKWIGNSRDRSLWGVHSYKSPGWDTWQFVRWRHCLGYQAPVFSQYVLCWQIWRLADPPASYAATTRQLGLTNIVPQCFPTHRPQTPPHKHCLWAATPAAASTTQKT